MTRRLIITFLFCVKILLAQEASISGTVYSRGKPVPSATIRINNKNTLSDTAGHFHLSGLAPGAYMMETSSVGFETNMYKILLKSNGPFAVNIVLEPKSGYLNEIIVTGVSKATLLKESPAAITLISAKAIDKTIEPNLVDALVKNVPGLTAVKTGPNISKPFIRGLGYNRVLTLYDGIRQEGQQWGDEHGLEVDPYNIERAEVIKGPASLTFGSDALAGVVSFIPYLPRETDNKLRGRWLSEYQSNNGLIGNGLRLAKSNQHWLWTMQGSYRMAKNYSNAVDGRVYNTGFRETNAGSSVGHLSKKGSSTLSGTLYDNLQGIPDGSRDSLTRKFTKQIAEGELDDIKNRPIVQAHELNSYALSALHQHIQHYRLYTNNQYLIGEGQINLTAGFQQNVRREYNHPTAPQQAGLFVRLNTITYAVQYLLQNAHRIEITIGVNGMHQQNNSKAATDFPIPDYKLTDLGGYFYSKWKHRSLTLSGGLRYDVRQINIPNFYIRQNPQTGFSMHIASSDTTGAALQFSALQKTYTGISLSAGLTYQINERLSLKANVGRGYRSPNITEIASNGLDPGAHIIYLGNRNFSPEFSFQQDLGMSLSYRSMTASLSFFNNFIQHYIYLSQLMDPRGNAIQDAQKNKTFQYVQAAAQLYGAEATLQIHPESWQGFNFDNAISITYGDNKNKLYRQKGIYGEYISLIPPLKWLGSVSQLIKTRSQTFSNVNIQMETEFDAAQNRFLALYNTETATPGYLLLNLSAGTRLIIFKSGALQLQVQVNNVCNKSYQSHLSRLKYFEYYNASANGRMGIYNMGRNASVRTILNF